MQTSKPSSSGRWRMMPIYDRFFAIAPNSFGAVDFAYMSLDRLTDDDYSDIVSEAPARLRS